MEKADRRWLQWAVMSLLLLVSTLTTACLAFWYATWPFSPDFVISSSPWIEPQLRAWAKRDPIIIRGDQPWPDVWYEVERLLRTPTRRDEALRAVANCLDASDPLLREATFRSIDALAKEEPLPHALQKRIVAAIDDVNHDVARGGWGATFWVSLELVKPVLSRGLSSSDERIRGWALNRAAALARSGDRGDSQLLGMIISLLQDPSAAIRGSAIATLTVIGDPAVAGAVERLRDDSDGRVRYQVERFFSFVVQRPADRK